MSTPQSATPGEGAETHTMRTLVIDIAWQSVLCGLYRACFVPNILETLSYQLWHILTCQFFESNQNWQKQHLCSMHGVTDVLFLPNMNERTKIGIRNRLEREHCTRYMTEI